MRVAIMQPYLMPYIGYFQLIDAVDLFVLYDDAQYMKGGWINRNRILSKQTNTDELFTFSIIKDAVDTKINQRYFSNQFKRDKKKFISQLRTNYGKTPFSKEILPLIIECLNEENDNVAAFIKQTFEKINTYLGINTPLKLSSEIEADKSLSAQEKVISICKQLGATHYINAIGGKELYNQKQFAEEGMELSFLKPTLLEYPQWGQAFVSGLSILDVMMFNSVTDIKTKLLPAYELIK